MSKTACDYDITPAIGRARALRSVRLSEPPPEIDDPPDSAYEEWPAEKCAAERDVGEQSLEQTAPNDPFGVEWKTIGELGPWFTEAPPPIDWVLCRGDDGALQREEVGFLIAPGNTGKSMALIQLALSIATGRDWLGTFNVKAPGPVLIALAEEKTITIRRRMYRAALQMGLDAHERNLANDRIVPLGLSGHSVNLIDVDLATGVATPSQLHHNLLRRIGDLGPTVVLLDPLARFGPRAESSNEIATALIQALEQIASLPSKPAVIVAHHTNKQSRNEGGESAVHHARGVTALTDGARWNANMSDKKGGAVEFKITKANHIPREAYAPVMLVRDREYGGTLRLQTDDERDAVEVERTDVKQTRARSKSAGDAAIAAGEVARTPGITARGLRANCASAAGSMSSDRVEAAVATLTKAGAILTREGSRSSRLHYLDGSKLPEDVARAIQGDDRATILASRWPSEAPNDPA